MSVVYTRSTQLMYKEISNQQKITNDKNDMDLPLSKRKNARKLYEGDTDKFEPIPENREHLIRTMLPMIVKIAKTNAKRFDRKIEFDDCRSAGLLGATIATDIYIKKSAIEKQPAKLSSFAYFYIEKYIKEYCKDNLTILSSGVTKIREATGSAVLEGNAIVNDDGKATEFFDICGDSSVITEMQTSFEHHEAESASAKLLAGLSTLEKNVLIMHFGIATIDGETLTPREIAKVLSVKTSLVKNTLATALETLREKMQNSKNSSEILEALRGVSFNKLKNWQIQ